MDNINDQWLMIISSTQLWRKELINQKTNSWRTGQWEDSSSQTGQRWWQPDGPTAYSIKVCWHEICLLGPPTLGQSEARIMLCWPIRGGETYDMRFPRWDQTPTNLYMKTSLSFWWDNYIITLISFSSLKIDRETTQENSDFEQYTIDR